MRSAKPRCLKSHSWSLWKALKEEGCINLVPWPLDLRCRSFWILNEVFSLKMKLNPNWTFLRNWEVFWVLFERYWWLGFNEIYFMRFGLRMREILSFGWFLSLKFQINSKNLGFGRKNQLKTWSNLQVYNSIQLWGIGKWVHTWANGTCQTSTCSCWIEY
jgi:hypothetical protein